MIVSEDTVPSAACHRLFLVYEIVDDDMHHDEKQGVEKEDERLAHLRHKVVEDNNDGGEKKDGDHGPPTRHACAHQFVVDVVLVREEWVAAVTYAAHEDPDNIKQRYRQGREDDDTDIMEIRIPDRMGLPEMQHDKAEGIAEGQWAGIAHEHLVPTTEDIIAEERYEHTEICYGEHSPHDIARHDTEDDGDKERDARQTWGETVNAVDEVDGVRDIDDKECRQRHANPERDTVDIEYMLEGCYPQPADAQQHGSAYLHHELDPVADTMDIVVYAEDI